jgi:hypothetical protein
VVIVAQHHRTTTYIRSGFCKLRSDAKTEAIIKPNTQGAAHAT